MEPKDGHTETTGTESHETGQFSEREKRLFKMLEMYEGKAQVRIECATKMSPECLAEIEKLGFSVFQLDDDKSSDAQYMKTLDTLVYSAQHYSDQYTPPEALAQFGDKVAIVYTGATIENFLKNEQFRYNWALNRSYGQTFRV